MSSDRFSIQDDAYAFPYHYLPDITPDGRIIIYRLLGWGLEYLTYITYIRDRIIAMRPQSICDVGCGDGRLLTMLAGHIPRRVGVDLSSRAIAFAQAFDPHVEWYCCPLSEVPGKYDIVTCVETLEHIPDGEVPRFVAALRAKVSETGGLIVSVPTVNRMLNPKHYRHYTAQLLEQQLTPHFVISETAWLFKNGAWTSFLNRLLTNGLFVLQHGPTLRLIRRIHQRYGFFASPQDEVHLVAIASPDTPKV
jgi:SAM-dependent methyltransferase